MNAHTYVKAIIHENGNVHILSKTFHDPFVAGAWLAAQHAYSCAVWVKGVQLDIRTIGCLMRNDVCGAMPGLPQETSLRDFPLWNGPAPTVEYAETPACGATVWEWLGLWK